MKLYYSKGACSLVVRIIINELGLKTTFESVNLKNKKTETDKDYWLINSKGGVPALEIESGKILTENGVILQYLADNEKAVHLLPELKDLKRYRVLEWVNYVATELHKGIGILFVPSIPESVRDEVFIPLIKKKLAFVNSQLEENNYLLGDEFTLPDAYLFVMLLWVNNFKIDLQPYPNLVRYFDHLKNRKSIQKSMSDEGIEL